MSAVKWAIGLGFLFHAVCAPAPAIAQEPVDARCKGEKSCRVLTDNEIALAETVFGNRIDYRNVRIINESSPIIKMFTIAMSYDGNIHLYRKQFQSDDHAMASNDKRDNFMHEMTHVWQYQSGVNVKAKGINAVLRHPFNFKAVYHYEPGKAFSQYSFEQQARIVQDFVHVRGKYEHAKDNDTFYQSIFYETARAPQTSTLLACNDMTVLGKSLFPLPLKKHECLPLTQVPTQIAVN